MLQTWPRRRPRVDFSRARPTEPPRRDLGYVAISSWLLGASPAGSNCRRTKITLEATSLLAISTDNLTDSKLSPHEAELVSRNNSNTYRCTVGVLGWPATSEIPLSAIVGKFLAYLVSAISRGRRISSTSHVACMHLVKSRIYKGQNFGLSRLTKCCFELVS